MKLPLQQTGFDESAYERPNQKWVCGHAAEGCPCELGPDRHGRCPSAAFSTCQPQLQDGRYRCTRPPTFGGPCEKGPGPDGSCCAPAAAHAPCQPRLSLRARRNRWTLLAASAMLGLLLTIMAGPWGRHFVSPGPLAAAHAGLPAPDGEADNCAACHESSAPSESAALFVPSFAKLGSASSDKCIGCHFASEPQGKILARLPHGSSLAQLRWAEDHGLSEVRHASVARIVEQTLFPQAQRHAMLACTTCHRDHHGAIDLTSHAVQSCHSCHGEVKSFTMGHPELTPRHSRAGIAFDHASHAQPDHFGERSFRCGDCHGMSDADGRMSTFSFERSCAGCHIAGEDDHHGLQIARSPAVTLFAMLDPEDYDANPGLPPMLSLLLSATPEAREVVQSLGPADVFADLEDDQKALVMKELLKLQQELVNRDSASLKQRLSTSLGPTVDSSSLGGLASSLLLGRSDATGKQLTHVVTQHGDEFLRRWLELRHAMPATEDSAAAKTQGYLEQIAQTAGKSCLRCHTPEPHQINWTAAGRMAGEWSYRKFDHRSHLMVLGATACAQCHPATAPGEGAGSSTSPPTGLLPVRASMCADCHRPDSGGLDSCLTCHQYHLHRP